MPPHAHRDHDPDHDDFGGLHRDVRMLGRRRALALLGGAGLAGLAVACGSDGSTSSAGSTTSTTAGTSSTTAAVGGSTTSTTAATGTATAGEEIPDETQGPYPADGSNGPNVLTEDGIVRSDITTSFGSSSGTAEGVPTVMNLTVVDAATGAAKPGAALYLWHCTAGGAYSIYEEQDQNYLRGVQEADANGRVSFATVFPGCYSGRWPHAHFEVYDSLDVATNGSQATKVSQLALPQGVCEAVYAESSYDNSLDNLGRLSLETDGIFSDGWTDQLATVSGSVADGYTVNLLVRV